MQVVVPTNYSNDNNEITYINKDGLKSDRNENPNRNPDGTYTDAEGHTIMADENENLILPKDAPEYYSWFQPLKKTDTTENNGTVVIHAELVRNSNGQLVAVGTDTNSSLQKTFNDFIQGFSVPENSPVVDTLLEAKKLNEGMKFLFVGTMLDDVLGNKFSKAKEIGRVEEKVSQSWSEVVTKGSSNAKTELHHIATDKSKKFDFKDHPAFKETGIDVSKDIDNLVELAGHRGRHTNAYHQEVQRRLDAVYERFGGTDKLESAVRNELNNMRKELLDGTLNTYGK